MLALDDSFSLLKCLFPVMDNQHSELRAPVADVVLSDDDLAGEFQRTGQRIADDGAAQVPDVHFLREVRAGVVHHDGVGVLRDGHAEAFVGQGGSQPPAEPVVFEGDVDESGPGDLDGLGDIVQVGVFNDRRRQFARVGFHLLRGGHAPVDLVVAKLRPRGGFDQGRGVLGSASPGEGAGDASLEFVAEVHSPSPLSVSARVTWITPLSETLAVALKADRSV